MAALDGLPFAAEQVLMKFFVEHGYPSIASAWERVKERIGFW